ncbi:MAG: hypothetical protein PHQ19_07170 [Candidatus Krumholzibacteria bacterium]|nr:hypothetical protein [Candidatus Krumholzibacteria bacterium]
MKIHGACVLLIVFVLAILGCEGPEGPRGPAGTANVIYSDWYSPETWTLATVFGVHERSYTMTTASLTQDIIDNGVVMVYMRFVGLNPEISQLPVTLADVNYSFLFRAQAGSIKVVYWIIASPTIDPVVIPPQNLVRYVLIPGGVIDEAAVGSGITGAQLIRSLESMPYREVCELLDIPE